MDKEYDLVMVVTCTSSGYIEKMIESVVENNAHIQVLIVALLQNRVRMDVKGTEYVSIHYINSNELMSLSRARNIALDYVDEKMIKYRYVMFPDDDSSFDRFFFENFRKSVKACSLIDVYGTGTRILYKAHKMTDKQRLSIKDHVNAMSVNMIISSDVQMKVGKFDENLGVGTYYGAGEDCDYFLRCLENGAEFYYVKDLWNYHPLNAAKLSDLPFKVLKKRYQSYGRGAVYMFLKHEMRNDAGKCILGGIGGIVISLIKFDPKMALVRGFAVKERIKTYISFNKGN